MTSSGPLNTNIESYIEYGRSGAIFIAFKDTLFEVAWAILFKATSICRKGEQKLGFKNIYQCTGQTQASDSEPQSLFDSQL